MNADVEEKVIWQGHSSPILHLSVYLLSGLAAGLLLGLAILFWNRLTPPMNFGLLALLGLPLLFCAAKWIQNRCRRYEITTQRLRLRHGVFSRKTDEVELYRVKDYTLVEPFLLRLFGLGNIVVTSTDDSNGLVVIEAVPDAQQLRDEIRKHVEICRDRKRVRIAEME